MKTSIKITVTAYITSHEADAEKSASGVMDLEEGGTPEWGRIMDSLARQATAHGPDDFPLEDGKLMTPEQVEEYLDKQDAAAPPQA